MADNQSYMPMRARDNFNYPMNLFRQQDRIGEILAEKDSVSLISRITRFHMSIQLWASMLCRYSDDLKKEKKKFNDERLKKYNERGRQYSRGLPPQEIINIELDTSLKLYEKCMEISEDAGFLPEREIQVTDADFE